MIRLGTILVPHDFSPHSDAALRRAVDLAKQQNGKIHLLHAYAWPMRGVMPYDMAVPAGVWDAIREGTMERLEEIRADVAKQGVEATAEVSALLPVEAILTAQKELHADVIALGTRGFTGLKHVVLGSTAERTVRVAVVLAKLFGADLHVVHAFDIPLALVTPYEVTVPDNLIREARDAARKRLDAAIETVKAKGVSATAHLAEVPAATAIVEVASETKADLIVIGTRGHTGLKHVLLGSVAERTLRLAPCAVLTVKKAEG